MKIIVIASILVISIVFLYQNEINSSQSSESLESQSKHYQPSVVVDNNGKTTKSQIKLNNRQEEENSYLLLKSFFEIHEFNNISSLNLKNCNICFQLIKQELTNNNNVTIEKVDALLSALQENNEVANLLIESVILRIKQQGNSVDTNSAKIMSKIASFSTLETAKISIENIKNNNLPIELKNVLIEQIDNTKDRAAIADYLMTTFKDDKSILIEIAHPETLALLLKQNDEEFNTFIEEPLVENGSKYTALVFLDLFKKANNNTEKQEKIINMAQQWASNQLSGSRIDFIEENLSKNLFSSEDKILIEKILNNAEDQSKSAYLLQKYFVPTL